MQQNNSLASLRGLKPTEDIDLLIKTLSPYATPISARSGQRFNYLSSGKAMCYLIYTGSVTVHRAHDGRVVSSAHAPVLLGTGNYIVPLDPTYITVNETMKMGVISVEELSKRLDENGLWKSFSLMLLFTVSHYLHQNLNMVAPTSYEKIRVNILELNKEPDEIKMRTNLARYIQDRTLLSRSHIMRILAELKKGRHIEVQRGILVSATNLPKQF